MRLLLNLFDVEELLEAAGGHRLWPFEWETEGTVPGEGREDAHGTGYAEENRVVVHLGEAVVLEEDARVGVDVWPRVLGLSVLLQDVWDKAEDLLDKVDVVVVLDVLLGKLLLADEPWVWNLKDGVAVAWDDASGVEERPGVVDELLVGRGFSAHLLDGTFDEDQHFLVGQAVERAGEAVQGGGEGQVRVREGRADKVARVGRDVAAFVVGVDRQVQTHEFNKVLVVAKAKHVGVVPRQILVWVDGGELAVLEDVTVDGGGNGWELCDAVH